MSDVYARGLVLVVEDEFLIAMALAAVLKDEGWQVLGPASSVDEAMDLLKDTTPDVALLDVNLGGELVTPVAEALHEQKVPFLLVSARDAILLPEPILARATNVGKPINEVKLFKLLAEAVSPASPEPDRDKPVSRQGMLLP